MRTAFIESLTEAAAKDPNVMLVVGDLGFGVVLDFAKRFPKQFLNVGVAEQNMSGVAAGLALAGKTVFTYSIANFPTLRCLEQIRNDICYHNGNVVVVAVGGGLAYGSLGMSHHATEDLSIMRSIPNLSVIAPGDPHETHAAVQYAAGGVGPVYLRLGRAGEPTVHDSPTEYHPGKAIQVRAGGDAALFATGGMVYTAVQVAKQLAKDGIDLRVISTPSIQPFDHQIVTDAAKSQKLLISLEEHSTTGGLGSAIAETLIDEELTGFHLHRIGLKPEFSGVVGDQDHLKKVAGLDADSVAAKIQNFLGRHQAAIA